MRARLPFQILPGQGTYFLVADFSGLLPEGSDEDDVSVRKGSVMSQLRAWMGLYYLIVTDLELFTTAVLLPAHGRRRRDAHPRQRVLQR